MLVAMGVCLTLAGNIISYTYHTYQTEFSRREFARGL